LVRDPWQLTIPASLPTGTYDLALTLIDQDRHWVGNLVLGSLVIEGREHDFSLIEPPEKTQLTRLGETVHFLGYDLEGAVAGEGLVPGRELQVALTWQAQSTPEQNYTVFVQLLDEAGQVRAQHDGQPGGGSLITMTWAPGEYVRDEHRLTLPNDLAVGDYRLIVGMYLPDSGERLRVVDEASQHVGDHIILNTRLHVPAGAED
jgi:hypothetical protein